MANCWPDPPPRFHDNQSVLTVLAGRTGLFALISPDQNATPKKTTNSVKTLLDGGQGGPYEVQTPREIAVRSGRL